MGTFIEGFVKRASAYGFSEQEALELLKEAKRGDTLMWDMLRDPHHVFRRGSRADLQNFRHAARIKNNTTTDTRNDIAARIKKDRKAKIVGRELSEEYMKHAALEDKTAAPASKALHTVLGNSTGRTLVQDLPDVTRAALSKSKARGSDEIFRKRLAEAAKKVRSAGKLKIDLSGE